MDLKTALNQLKKVGPEIKLPFFYLEADAKGKPVVLVGNAIVAEKPKVLKGAKINKTAVGKMALSADGDLKLQARGNGMDKLLVNMKKATSVAGSVVKKVSLGAPEVEEEAPAPAQGDATAAQKPAGSDAWKTTPIQAGDKISDVARRAGMTPADYLASSGLEKPASAQPPPAATAWQQATGRSDGGKGSFLGNQRAAATPPVGPTNQQAAPTSSARQTNYVDDLNLGASKAAKPGQATYEDTLDLREEKPATVRPSSDGKATYDSTLDLRAAQAAKSKPAGDGQATYVDNLDLRAAKAAKSRPAGDTQATSEDTLDLREEKPATAKPPGDGKATYEDLLDLEEEKTAPDAGAQSGAQPGRKKFPDAAPVTPARAELNRLIAQRDKLQNALDFTEKDNKKEKPADAVLRAAAKLREMDKEIRERLVQLNETGFAAKAMHSDYEGEDEKAGWKAGDKPKMPEITPGMKPEEIEKIMEKHRNAVSTWEDYRESDISTRKNFSAEEKAKSKMSVNDFGQLLDANGRPVTADAEYVMDAEEGKFHQFQPGAEKTGEYQLLGAKQKSFDGEKRTHHSSVLSGADVAGAGGIKAKDGEVTMVTNLSGHYRPGVGQTIQTVEELLKLGALLDKTWVDKDGIELEGKVLELYVRTRQLQRTLTAKLQADPAADVKQDQKNLDAAMAMCRKLGLGPANRIRDNAKVGMIETTPDMTGAEIKAEEEQVEENAIPAEEFLRSGGGNETQEEAKNKMMQELEQRTKKRKARLDAAAKTGVGPAPVTEEELEAQVDELNPRAVQRRARRAAAMREEERAAAPAGGGDGATGKANYTEAVLEEKSEGGTQNDGSAAVKTNYTNAVLEESGPGSASEGPAGEKSIYTAPDIEEEEEVQNAAAGEKTNYIQPSFGADDGEAKAAEGKATYTQPNISGGEEERASDGKATYTEPNVEEEAETETTAERKANYTEPEIGGDEAEGEEGKSERKANYTDPFTGKPDRGDRRQ